MKISQLQYFLEVVRTNNITKAAKNLFVSQPAISKAINELEKEFNVTLFIRYNNQLTLTDEGHYLYEKGIDLINSVNDLKEQMINYKKAGPIIKIGVPPMLGTFVVSELVTRYQDVSPNTQIQLIELGSVANREAIKNHEIEFGFTVIKDGKIEEELDYINIVKTDLLYAVAKTNPLAKKSLVTLEEIEKQPLILMKEDCLQSHLIQKAFSKKGLTPNLKVRTNQIYTMRELLIKNNLSAFIFSQILTNDKDIVGIPLQEGISLDIVIAYRKGAKLNESATKFLNYVKNELSENKTLQ